MHNVAAVAVEDRREVVKRAVNVEVADVDMPGRNGDITDFHPFGRRNGDRGETGTPITARESRPGFSDFPES
jgi:hypothetical protein